MQQMRRSVVRHRRETNCPRHDRAHAVTLGELAALQEEHLILLEAIRVAQLRARGRIAVELDPPGVGDLPATGGIERRLAELCEEETVLELLERAELRQDVR